MKDVQFVGTEYVCHCCGKHFWFTYTGYWVYKINHKFYCSYTCFRKAQKEIEKNTKTRRKYAKKGK